MGNFILLLLFTFLLIVVGIQSLELSPRNAAYCAYLSNKIFCYGGSPADQLYDNSINALDINQPSGTQVNSLLSQWAIIDTTTNKTEISTEYRYDSAFVPLPDGVSMLFEGGSNDNAYPIMNKTATYNTQTNTWQALPQYNEPTNGGFRQIETASAVYMPNINCIGFYGGKEFHSNPKASYITPTGTALPSNLIYSYPSQRNHSLLLYESYVGFYSLALFNLSNYMWSVPTQANLIPFLVEYQTATFHPRTGKVYYLGGYYHDIMLDRDSVVPLTFSLTYDTISAVWENKTLNTTNGIIPTPRSLHTATLLPATNEDIVVYGGIPTDPNGDIKIPVMDYLYTLNLVTFSWTAFNLPAPTGGSGPRYYHSAVLVNNTSLFILLGKPKDYPATNSILVLDVRNPASLVFSDTYPLLDTSSSSNSQLSTGAIAGIAVAIVVVALIAAAGIFFCIRKKRRARAAKMEELEVDWDRIEGEFSEVPPISNFPEGSKSLTSTMKDTVTTISPQVPFSSIDHQKIRASMYSPGLATDIDVIKPDGAGDPVIKSVVRNSSDQLIRTSVVPDEGKL